MAMELLQPATRFVQYAVLLGLFGGFGFHAATVHTLARANGRRAPVIFAAMAAPAVVAASLMTDIGAMMGQALLDLDVAMIWSMVSATDFGRAGVLRLLLVGLAGLLVSVLALSRVRAVTVAALYAAALATMAWSGHAAATEGVVGWVHRLNDAVHLLAAGYWLGAIGWFTLLVSRAQSTPDPARNMALAAALDGFAPIGAALVLAVAVTGVVNSQMIFGISQALPLLKTVYGQLLALKLALVALMLACAWSNRAKARVMTEHFGDGSTQKSGLLKEMRKSLILELLSAVSVIATVAFLGLASPMPAGN